MYASHPTIKGKPLSRQDDSLSCRQPLPQSGLITCRLVSASEFWSLVVKTPVPDAPIIKGIKFYREIRLSPLPKDAPCFDYHNYLKAYEFHAPDKKTLLRLEEKGDGYSISCWEPVGLLPAGGKYFPVFIHAEGVCHSEGLSETRLFYGKKIEDALDCFSCQFKVLHGRYIVSVDPSKVSVYDIQLGQKYVSGKDFSDILEEARLLLPAVLIESFISSPVVYPLRNTPYGFGIYIKREGSHDLDKFYGPSSSEATKSDGYIIVRWQHPSIAPPGSQKVSR